MIGLNLRTCEEVITDFVCEPSAPASAPPASAARGRRPLAWRGARALCGGGGRPDRPPAPRPPPIAPGVPGGGPPPRRAGPEARLPAALGVWLCVHAVAVPARS